MKELMINEYQAKEIEDTLRLVFNIYRANIKTGETCFDRKLKRSREYIKQVLDNAESK